MSKNVLMIENAHDMKIIPFPGGLNLIPGNNVITDPDHIRTLRVNEKALKMYCNTVMPGTKNTVLTINGGDIHDWVKGDPVPEGEKAPTTDDEPEVSPVKDKPLKDALLHVGIMNDINSLKLVAATDKRREVKALAKKKIAELEE